MMGDDMAQPQVCSACEKRYSMAMIVCPLCHRVLTRVGELPRLLSASRLVHWCLLMFYCAIVLAVVMASILTGQWLLRH